MRVAISGATCIGEAQGRGKQSQQSQQACASRTEQLGAACVLHIRVVLALRADELRRGGLRGRGIGCGASGFAF